MKKIAKIIFCIAFSLLMVFGSCKKENTKPSILNGKIKRIQETLTIPNRTHSFDLYFLYDSTDGRLQKITLNNKLYIEISKKIDNYIILNYDASLRDSTPSPNFIKIKIYLDNDGYINKLVYVDSATTPLQELMNIYISNDGYPDSVREFVGGFTTASRHYNFQIQNGNVIQSIHDYSGFLSGDNTNTLKYYYTNKLNNDVLPAQFSSIYFYAAAYSTSATDPFFLLGFNGYLPFKKNVNLLDSIVNIENNTTLKYDYTTNSSNQIVKLKRYSNTTSAVYDIEYY